MHNPTSDDLQRLGFVSLVYRQAQEQSRAPYPLSVTAVLTVHDAVELYALLIADRVGLDLTKRTEFEGYWSHINNAGGPRLGQSGKMKKLNACRVNFKHHGILPAASVVDDCLADAGLFFRDNTPKFFGGLSFERVSLVSLVTQPRVRQLLELAEGSADADPAAAAMCISAAYEALADAFNRPGEPLHDMLEVALGSSYSRIHIRGSFARPKIQADAAVQELAEHVNKLGWSVEEIRRGLGLQLVGVDLRDFLQFRLLMPRMSRSINGVIGFDSRRGQEWTDDELARAVNFVVMAALGMAETQTRLEAVPSLYRPPSSDWTYSGFDSIESFIELVGAGMASSHATPNVGLDRSQDSSSE
ncbi:MAG TPA: hypothetical protein VHO91_02205 [Rhodopila sp.]|nr:hypothetical protein [Rhodopila sp.]